MSIKALESLTTAGRGRAGPSIAPLLWVRGEPPELLRQEIQRIHESGIRAFIVESRPHPDFVGPRWWRDLDAIVAEAKSLAMQVWIFDDSHYPTGFANGAIRDRYPQRAKRFLRRETIEAAGPLPGASFRVGSWCAPGESILAVAAGRLADHGGRIGGRLDGSSLLDLTPLASDGLLFWDVPEGRWRVFVIVVTSEGGEEGTRFHVNPIDPESVKVLIDTVYEPHYRRYASEFGKTVAGFFSDEPRFGNIASYDARIGRLPMILPYREGLLEALSSAWGGSFAAALPSLWEDAGELSSRARLRYMDVVSGLYGECFSRQIGDWCAAHGVRSIGHVVEDNGAHARLGYGSGHFFRALSGQQASGFDMVYQVWPEHDQGRYLTPFGDLDARFFHWGIAKLASSAGHLDPRKEGTTVCELFGAYGWRLGLRMMKWLTDHACVRGANFLIPHAFSPREFPDPDCPPHFYARGNNPQWRYFGEWARYADRVCGLLSGGEHVASIAVLYHAEAEWAGECEPFEIVVKELALRQIDCDVVPVDLLVDPRAARLEPGALTINRERYSAIVVPHAELLPRGVLERLRDDANAGVRVVFGEDLPKAPIEGARDRSGGDALAELRSHPFVSVLARGSIAAQVRAWGLHEIECTPEQPRLRVYHYRKADRDLWFLVNEDTHRPVRSRVLLRGATKPIVAYDPMSDRTIAVEEQERSQGAEVVLGIERFGSLFLISPARDLVQAAEPPLELGEMSTEPIDVDWEVSASAFDAYPTFKPAAGLRRLGNAAAPGLFPRFSGTLRYLARFERPVAAARAAARVWLDLGEAFETVEAWLNDARLGVRICPPYRFEVASHLTPGMNALRVEVTNTLAKAFGDNNLDRAMPQDPTGLLGPVCFLIKR